MQGAGGVGGLLMIQDGSERYLPAYDTNGNVHAMIKASNGAIAVSYEYDAFGRTLREHGEYKDKNPFRFSTKYTDLETGLIYYGLRYYSPSMGRFINRDPIGERGGLNLYVFVRNNGVNSADYLGMAVITIDTVHVTTTSYRDPWEDMQRWWFDDWRTYDDYGWPYYDPNEYYDDIVVLDPVEVDEPGVKVEQPPVTPVAPPPTVEPPAQVAPIVRNLEDVGQNNDPCATATAFFLINRESHTSGIRHGHTAAIVQDPSSGEWLLFDIFSSSSGAKGEVLSFSTLDAARTQLGGRHYETALGFQMTPDQANAAIAEGRRIEQGLNSGQIGYSIFGGTPTSGALSCVSGACNIINAGGGGMQFPVQTGQQEVSSAFWGTSMPFTLNAKLGPKTSSMPSAVFDANSRNGHSPCSFGTH